MGDAGTKPEITPDIAFNGIEDESHESFVLPASGLGDFEFCKTAQKPYDEVVVAALARLAEVEGIKVSSDGNAADWEDGVKLASKVLGRKVSNPLGLREVKSSFAEKIKAKYILTADNIKHTNFNDVGDKNYEALLSNLTDKAFKLLMQGVASTLYLIYVPAEKGTPDVDIISEHEDLKPKYEIGISLNASMNRHKIRFELNKVLRKIPIYIEAKYEIGSAAKRILKRDVKLKDGRTYAKGTIVEVKFLGNIDKENGHRICEIHTETDSWKLSIGNLPSTVSGFVKPSEMTMEKWSEEGYSKTPTGKKTEPDGYADDGSPSWLLALGLI